MVKKKIKKFWNNRSHKKNYAGSNTLSGDMLETNYLSSIIKKNRLNKSLLSFVNLKSSLVNFKKKLKIQKNLTLFSDMAGWKVDNTTISDIKKKFFSIFFIEVKANRREVKNFGRRYRKDFIN